MPVCSNKDWSMDIIAGNGAIVASPVFTKITITGTDIDGEVHLPIGTKISGLKGKCVPLASNPNIAAVHFRFRLKDSGSEIGMLMSGIGFFRSGATEADFRGRWIAHDPGADTPPADNLIEEEGLVLPGSGDTGSGTGTTT
jgi:hypothetical protein